MNEYDEYIDQQVIHGIVVRIYTPKRSYFSTPATTVSFRPIHWLLPQETYNVKQIRAMPDCVRGFSQEFATRDEAYTALPALARNWSLQMAEYYEQTALAYRAMVEQYRDME
ncbi:MAG: hypothetical protein IT564_11425 [Rhodospirillales bacterium]|nr:hypothetical protein [Rhodospirillales bacterium]